MLSVVKSLALQGLDGRILSIEVDISCGLPCFEIVGLPDTSIKEAKERVKTAIRNTGVEFLSRRIVVNLAPADIRKEGASLDLPIALGILIASGQIENNYLNTFLEESIFVGELSLDGFLRPVCGILPLVVQLFALAERNLQLYTRIFQIDGEGNDRIALQLDLGKQMHNLALVQQKPARTHGVFVVDIALIVRADMHLADPQLAVLDRAPGILEIQRTEPDGFHLRTGQLDAGLKAVLDKVFMKHLGVFCKNFDAFRLQPAHLQSILYYISFVKCFLFQTGVFPIPAAC